MDSIPQASVAELSYIAGYVDGEGCIRWDRHTPCLALETCNPAPLKFIKRIFGGNITSRTRTIKGKTWRTAHLLRYYGDSCVLVITMITPYLIEKRDQAEHLIEIRRLKQLLNEAKRKNHT
jgi:hypothetical protein